MPHGLSRLISIEHDRDGLVCPRVLLETLENVYLVRHLTACAVATNACEDC